MIAEITLAHYLTVAAILFVFGVLAFLSIARMSSRS